MATRHRGLLPNSPHTTGPGAGTADARNSSPMPSASASPISGTLESRVAGRAPSPIARPDDPTYGVECRARGRSVGGAREACAGSRPRQVGDEPAAGTSAACPIRRRTGRCRRPNEGEPPVPAFVARRCGSGGNCVARENASVPSTSDSLVVIDAGRPQRRCELERKVIQEDGPGTNRGGFRRRPAAAAYAVEWHPAVAVPAGLAASAGGRRDALPALAASDTAAAVGPLGRPPPLPLLGAPEPQAATRCRRMVQRPLSGDTAIWSGSDMRIWPAP